jgi:hypothetical protein
MFSWDEALQSLYGRLSRVQQGAAAAGSVSVQESEATHARKIQEDIEELEALVARKKAFETSVQIRKLFPLFEKEAQLVVARAETADDALRFQYTDQLRAARARREAAEQEIFIDLVMRVDYRRHEDLFGRWLLARRAERIAPAVVCGDPDHGLYWLVNRLRRRIPPSTEPPFVVCSSFRTGAVEQGLSSVYAGFARRLGLPPGADRASVLQKICDKWKWTNLVLLFSQVGSLGAAGFASFLAGFWGPLVREANARRAPSASTWIAAFFLHDGAASDFEGAPLCAAPDKGVGPEAPLLLPPLGTFARADIEGWQSANAADLPESMQSDDAVSEIVASSKGLPSDALYAICRHFGHDFDVLTNLWEKL